jgi:hypothetical protein
MGNTTTVRRVKARSLGATLRRRLRLAPAEEVDVTIKKRSEPKTKKSEKDPWKEIKGILSHEEAEEMRRAIAAGRLSRAEAPKVSNAFALEVVPLEGA